MSGWWQSRGPHHNEIGGGTQLCSTFAYKATNNEVEYEALLVGMAVARLLGVEELDVRSGFQVVVSQVLGQFVAKGDRLKKYIQLIYNEHDRFRYFRTQKIPRAKNQKADRLARATSGQDESQLSEQTNVKTIDTSSIGMEKLAIAPTSPQWAVDIRDLFQEDKLPDDPEEVLKVKNRAA